MNSIVSDVLLSIFDLLSYSEIVKIKLVNRRWNSLIIKKYQSSKLNFRLVKRYINSASMLFCEPLIEVEVGINDKIIIFSHSEIIVRCGVARDISEIINYFNIKKYNVCNLLTLKGDTYEKLLVGKDHIFDNKSGEIMVLAKDSPLEIFRLLYFLEKTINK